MSRDGECIDLVWEDTPEFWAVRGHVDTETACSFAAEWFDDYDYPLPSLGFVVERQWARWSMEPGQDGPTHTIRMYRKPGRGRFKVTVAYDADVRWHESEARRERQESEARVRAEVARRWPGSEVVEVARFGVTVKSEGRPDRIEHPWGSRFNFPGGQGHASWSEGRDFVHVQQRDLDAWNAYREHNPEPAEAAHG